MDTPSTDDDRPNIVIIDDSTSNLQILTEILQQKNYLVRVFTNGYLAEPAMRKNPPDIILLDVSMPEISGYELCKRFKKDPALKEIPVIFVSGYSKAIDKLQAFDAGGIDYIVKPFQIQDVQTRVEIHLGLRWRQHELQKAYHELEQQKSLARQSSVEAHLFQGFYDNIVHDLVHDLHQPMNGMMIYLDLLELQDGPRLSAAGRESIARIRSSGDQMIKMIHSILDVHETATGTVQLVRTSSDPAQLIREAMVRVDPLKGERTLELVVPANLPMVTVDTVLIVRVLENLLGNAIQFSPADGQIVIRFETGESGLRITVSDNGPEIPAEHQAGVFEKFCQRHQGDRSMGTGFCLPFCKLIIEAHGGTVGVQSQPGKGCSFWLTLPLS